MSCKSRIIAFSVSLTIIGGQTCESQQGRLPSAVQVPRQAYQLSPRQLTFSNRFNLGPTFGERARVEFKVREAGRIHLQASWSGSARRLALILNGPGQEGYYARQDATSPLVIDLSVGEEILRRGDEWAVSIVNFGRGTAYGVVEGTYPAPVTTVNRGSPVTQGGLRVLAQPPSQAPAEPSRTILENGTVELRYPNGIIRRFFPSCGTETIYPDGRTMRITCVGVQKNELPPLPSQLTDGELDGWVNELSERLLDTIKMLVNEAAVDHFLRVEEGKVLVEKIDMRSRCIEQLLTPDPSQ